MHLFKHEILVHQRDALEVTLVGTEFYQKLINVGDHQRDLEDVVDYWN